MIYFELFYVFFLIGLFTFGGGYAMIPLIKQSVLVERSWITENEFLDFLGVAESTPGPIAVNMATFIGTTQGGFLGALVATLGVILPSFIIILLIAMVLKKFIKNPYVVGFLNGIKPVVIGLIVSTGFIMLYGLLFKSTSAFDYRGLIIFVLLALIYYGSFKVFHKKIHPAFLILISAILGLIVYL